MTMKPNGRWILIRPKKKEDDNSSSIIVSTMEDNIPNEYAEIISTGNSVSKDITSGLVILWNVRSGKFVTVDNEELIIITEDDIFLIEANKNK